MVCCGLRVTLNFPCGLLWGESYIELPMWFGVGWELHGASHVVCCGVGVTWSFSCGLVWGGVTWSFSCGLVWGGSNMELLMWFGVGWE